jgi:hypothetical protein
MSQRDVRHKTYSVAFGALRGKSAEILYQISMIMSSSRVG